MSVPLRVLILEDQPAHAQLMLHELRRGGFAPEWSLVDNEADYLAHLDPALDVILADYSLPQFDGLGALNLLQERGLDIPFIVVSGTISEETAVEIMKQGAADYLFKPLLARLGQAVMHALEQKQFRDEKARAQEALRESEEYARNLIDSSLDMIISVDQERRIVEFNRAAEETFGYSREEVLGQPVDTLYAYPVEGGKIHEMAVEGGQCTTEVTNIRKNGEMFPSYLAASTLRNGKGEFLGVMGISRDITERKKAEEENRRLALAVANASDGVMITEMDGRISFVNPAAEKMRGYAPGEMLGMKVLDIYPESLRETIAREIFEATRNEGSWTGEVPLSNKTGEELLARLSTALIKDDEGHALGMVGIATDVTERKRAEDALRENETRLRLALDAAHTATFDMNVQTGESFVSGDIEGVYGLDPNSSIPSFEAFLDMVHPEDREKLASENVRAFETGEVPEVQFRIVWPNKEVHWIEARGELIHDEAGKPVRMIGINMNVTRRTQADERVRVLALALATTNDAVVISEMDGRISFVNRAAERVYGYDPGEMLGLEVRNLHPEAARDNTAREILEATMNAGDWTGEVIVQRKTGEEFPVRLGTALMRDGQGNSVGMVGITTDITERKRAEESLRLRTQELGALFNIASTLAQPGSFEEKYVGVLEELARVVQADLAVVWVPDEKQQALRMVAISSPALLESTIPPLISYEQSIGGMAFQQGEPVVANNYTAHPRAVPAATPRHINSVVALPIKAGGRTLGVVNVISREANHFTPQRVRLLTAIGDHLGGLLENARLYEESEDRASEIQRLDEFNDRIIASIPTALAVFRGKERVVESVNNAFRQAFGLTSGAVEGRPITEVLALEGLEEVIQESLLSEEPKARQEMRYITLEGGERWFVASAVPLHAEGEAEVLLIINDITEQKQHQEQLQETARLASIGELAAGVAHELNNPLAGVLGFAQLLMARELSPSISEDVNKIYDQAQRASKVVQNLLSFARKHPPERRYIDVTDTASKAVSLKVYDFNVSNIQVTFDFPADIPHTLADEHQLQQVFLNIIANAEQAMVEAHGRGILHINARKVGDSIRLSFADDGPGIPADHLKRIFDPFFTTRGVGRGTGLGLSICYGIVREHGGNIWAESQPGKGTTFHIELPILHPERVPESLGPDTAPKSALQLHILVVDDEPALRDLLFQALSGDGHTVDVVADGQEAWEMIQVDRYDCIIVDLRMPGISGQEFYRLVRDFDPALAQKIVFNTGDTASLEVRDFLEATGNPVLGKPFDLDELSRHIQGLAAAEK